MQLDNSALDWEKTNEKASVQRKDVNPPKNMNSKRTCFSTS